MQCAGRCRHQAAGRRATRQRHASKDEARGYRSYYSNATRDLVADRYAPEIALLGYGF